MSLIAEPPPLGAASAQVAVVAHFNADGAHDAAHIARPAIEGGVIVIGRFVAFVLGGCVVLGG